MIRLGNTVGDVFSIATIGQDAVAALSHHQRSSGVLTHGQNTTRGNVGVLKKIQRNILIVAGSFRVIQNLAQLCQVGWAQEVVDLAVGGVCQVLEGFR